MSVYKLLYLLKKTAINPKLIAKLRWHQVVFQNSWKPTCLFTALENLKKTFLVNNFHCLQLHGYHRYIKTFK